MKTQLILTRPVELLPELTTLYSNLNGCRPRVIFILHTATSTNTPITSQFNRTRYHFINATGTEYQATGVCFGISPGPLSANSAKLMFACSVICFLFCLTCSL